LDRKTERNLLVLEDRRRSIDIPRLISRLANDWFVVTKSQEENKLTHLGTVINSFPYTGIQELSAAPEAEYCVEIVAERQLGISDKARDEPGKDLRYKKKVKKRITTSMSQRKKRKSSDPSSTKAFRPGAREGIRHVCATSNTEIFRMLSKGAPMRSTTLSEACDVAFVRLSCPDMTALFGTGQPSRGVR